MARFAIEVRGRPYGVNSPYEMYSRALECRLEPDVIAQIRCPMLITDPENEQFWPGRARRPYDALQSPKELVAFTAAEGGDSHWEPKALGLRSQRIFDWLDETVG